MHFLLFFLGDKKAAGAGALAAPDLRGQGDWIPRAKQCGWRAPPARGVDRTVKPPPKKKTDKPNPHYRHLIHELWGNPQNSWRSSTLFLFFFVVVHMFSIHLLQPCRSQVPRSGPARAPAKPGKHVSHIRTHEHTRTHPTTMKTCKSKTSRQQSMNQPCLYTTSPPSSEKGGTHTKQRQKCKPHT